MVEKLIEFFKTDIISKSGYFSGIKLKKEWYIKYGYEKEYNELIQYSKKFPIEMSLNQILYHLFNSIDQIPMCEICNKKYRKFYTFTKGYRSTCCDIICVKNHPEYINKSKQTCLRKYGVEHHSKSNKIKQKKIETYINTYGVDNPSKVKTIQDKKKITCLDKFGTEYYAQSKNFKQKFDEIRPELRDKEWLIEQNKTKSLQQIAKELNITDSNVLYWIRIHNINYKKYSVSIEQKGIIDFLNEYNIYPKINDKQLISPYELDILIDNFAIELSGRYWHSHKFVNKDYHLLKYNLSKNKKINLIQLWDNEWILKQDQCKSLILQNLNLFPIDIKDYDIKFIDNKIYKQFVIDNSLYKYKNNDIKLGLYVDDELLSCISFKKIKNDFILLNYINKNYYNIVNGFDILFQYFIENNKFDNIISYQDKRIDNDIKYINNKFELISHKSPEYFFSKDYKVLEKNKIIKDNLNNYDINKTMKENMIDNKWYIVYDCGYGVWKYKR